MAPLSYPAVILNSLVALPLKLPKKYGGLPSVKTCYFIFGVGEGRATRECELIWCPIFETSTNGILTKYIEYIWEKSINFYRQVNRQVIFEW